MVNLLNDNKIKLIVWIISINLVHVYAVSSSSQADPLSTFSSTIPSTTVPVADLLPGGSPLKTNGADNDVDIVGIFGSSDQDAVFPEMPGGNFFTAPYTLNIHLESGDPWK